MGVPRRSCARLERDAGALNVCRLGCLKQRVDAYGTCEPIRRAFSRRLRANSFNLHVCLSLILFLSRLFFGGLIADFLRAKYSMQILRWQTVNNVPTPWRNLIRTR